MRLINRKDSNKKRKGLCTAPLSPRSLDYCSLVLYYVVSATYTDDKESILNQPFETGRQLRCFLVGNRCNRNSSETFNID